MKLGDVIRLLVLSDDGASSPTGTACKELARDDPPKLFRALSFIEAHRDFTIQNIPCPIESLPISTLSLR